MIGPFLKELSMFLELAAEVPFPSACLDRLMEELRPPAVDCVLGWLLKTRLEVVGCIDEDVLSALGV